MKRRQANQYSGGNLLTIREAERIKKWIAACWKMILERDFYRGVDRELHATIRALEKALEVSDRLD